MTDKHGPKKWVSGGYTPPKESKTSPSDLSADQPQACPKSDVRYWRPKVFKPVSVRGKLRVQGEHFAIKLQYLGKRMTLSLSSANREEAAQRARRMYLDLVAGGWELLLERHRPKPAVTPEPEKEFTFGEYIALVRSKNLIGERTLDSYVPRLRQIIAEIKGIKPSRKRYAANGKGRQTWVEKVDSIALSSITPDDVRRWKMRSIDRAKNNAILRKQYTVSTNSTLRQARSLFGTRKILKHLPQIPRPHLFEGVEFAPRVDMKFYGIPGLDAPTLLRLAIKELSGKRKEECKAFLLAIALGLRRKEADSLEWSSFDFVAGTVQIQPTRHYGLKTIESAATLILDPEIMALFKGWHAGSHGRFVIESDRPPRNTRYHYYRAERVFEALIGWLRGKGIKADKPFHTLRKVFGSLVVERHGIFAASAALRHTSIELTNAYYVDRTVRTTSGLGSILSGASVASFPAATRTDLLNTNRAAPG